MVLHKSVVLFKWAPSETGKSL